MTSTEFIVHAARPEDAPKIVEFQIRMADETEGLELDAAVVERGVHAVFDDPSRGQYWVCLEEDRVVGGLLTVPEWSDWRCATVLWIHSVYVTPEARGKGAFKRMYRELADRVSSSAEYAGLRLYVETGNERAQRVYEALGMDGSHYRMYEWLK